MWDPASNDPSAQQQQQQQQQRSSDLTTHLTTAAANATTDRGRHTLHTFEVKQPQDVPVTQHEPATDLLRYDDGHSSSYQQVYPLPSSQGGISGPSYQATGLPPPSSSSNGSFAPGLLSIIPQKTIIVHTVGPNSHQSQVLGGIGRSYLNKPNNIPMEIDTIGSSPQHSPVLGPEHTYDDNQLPFPNEPRPSPQPPSSETAPLLPPPQVSVPQQRYPQDQYSPTSSPTPALARSSSMSPPTSSRDASPCIARLSIPASHLSLFNEAIKSLPDPDLKIRKKTVRFNKNTSPPRSEHRHERSQAESYGSYSPSSKSSSTSTSSSHAVSSKSTSGSTKGSSLQLQIVEKDPEERMAELMELKQMKIRQEDLLHLKDQVFQTGQNLEEKQTILDEVRAERKMLHSELNRYILMVKQVQKDLELATNAETQLTKERDQLSQYLTQLRDHDFKVLKEEVDQLRSKKGLRPLPSLEQEQEEVMGRYLEERRGQWREDGVLQDSPSASSSHHSNQLKIFSYTKQLFNNCRRAINISKQGQGQDREQPAKQNTPVLFVLLKQIQT
ncbi:hypothetical protein KI688_009249 [Linnemannia hyalina]|uniref:Uncharacterized protein n=1 Tax=Linnemannia hyalina TaxID=64524 RepID=A0A9P8BV14_9FUNG|nr:hypothetical protein KI688_009249 [Linnemannia hyalina]